jgi:hypothetical protein
LECVCTVLYTYNTIIQPKVPVWNELYNITRFSAFILISNLFDIFRGSPGIHQPWRRPQAGCLLSCYSPFNLWIQTGHNSILTTAVRVTSFITSSLSWYFTYSFYDSVLIFQYHLLFLPYWLFTILRVNL